MAMSCEQIDAQMLDFLYGELPAGERAAFEAHAAGCERCRREVEAFGQTRAVARAVLDEAPPAHLRARIVRAARDATQATVPVPANLAPAKVDPARASLWARLRRLWALPTLATVGALAVFLLGSRLFLNPQTTAQRGREYAFVKTKRAEVHDPSAYEEAPPTPAAAAPPGDPPAHPARDLDSAMAEGRLQPARSAASKPVAAASAAHRRGGGAAPKAPVSRPLGNFGDDALGAASGSVASSPAKKSGRANAGPAPEPQDKSFAAADEPSGGLGSRGDMEAPKASAPAPAALASPAPPEREEAPARRKAEVRGTADRQAEDLRAEPRSAEAKAETSARMKKDEKPRAETLVQRADRLFTEGRWVEAAVAYRDLLRQQPNAADAERWRRRLAAAEAATATSRPPASR